jgi:hypothetical protein
MHAEIGIHEAFVAIDRKLLNTNGRHRIRNIDQADAGGERWYPVFLNFPNLTVSSPLDEAAALRFPGSPGVAF